MNTTGSVQEEHAGAQPGFRAGDALDPQAGYSLRTLLAIAGAAAAYYLATRIAWLLCFPDSKVSLFFPPHAILVSILLLVPLRRWWVYALAAAAAHFVATQQAGWPPLYALQCEAFDVVKAALTAAAIRTFTRSPFHRFSLREAVTFVLLAVVIVPFLAAFWGAAFTLANGFGTNYWVEWRNLGVSNGVTVIVLVPAILLGVHALRARTMAATPARVLEATLLAVGTFAVGYFAFDHTAAGPGTSPALLYAPIPLLIWAVLRFGLGGMCTTMLAITMLAIWGTMHGRGPFLSRTPEENALALQLFLLMVATPLLLLAAAIADERRSKEALRISEERVHLAAESGQLMLWDWDPPTDIVWMSEQGRRYFGFEPGAELHLRDLVDRVHPEDRAQREWVIQDALRTGASYEVEYRIVQPDGSVRWLAGRGRGYGGTGGGAAPRVLGVSMDITRQKEAAEEARLQRRELAHLSRVATLSTLSSSLAHELSQPLSSILSNAQAGQRFLAKDAPDLEEIREILAHIVGEDRRAGDIIERLRTLLRRGEVSSQPMDVNEVIADLLQLTRSDLMARRVSVDNLATGPLPWALADRVQLQQVLLNLIVNGCDAMAANPAEERRLTITSAVVDGELRIGVLDRGHGLPADVEALFQPFHTTKADGLGMGLAICRSLVTAHRGRLWAEAREGGGAAFYVALPLAQEPAAARCSDNENGMF